MIRLFAAALLVVGLPLLVGAGSVHDNADIRVTFINCPSQPRATIASVRKYGVESLTSETKAKSVGTTSMFEIELPQGVYLVNVHGGDCRGAATLVTLAGVTRDFPLTGRVASPEPLPSGWTVVGHISEPRPYYGLAGRLPLNGLAVSVTDDCGMPDPVTVEGKSFYSDLYSPGDYVIEVRGPNFGVQIKQRVNRENGLTVRDISLAEVKSDRFVNLPKGPDCL